MNNKLFILLTLFSVLIFSCSEDSSVEDFKTEVGEVTPSRGQLINSLKVSNGVLVFQDWNHYNSLIKEFSGVFDNDDYKSLESIGGYISYDNALGRYSQEGSKESYPPDQLFYEVTLEGRSFYEPIIPQGSILALLFNENLEVRVGNQLLTHGIDAVNVRNVDTGEEQHQIVKNKYTEIGPLVNSKKSLKDDDCNIEFATRRKLNGRSRQYYSYQVNIFHWRATAEKKSGIFGNWLSETIDALKISGQMQLYDTYTGQLGTPFAFENECTNCHTVLKNINVQGNLISVQSQSYATAWGNRNGTQRSCAIGVN